MLRLAVNDKCNLIQSGVIGVHVTGKDTDSTWLSRNYESCSIFSGRRIIFIHP